MLDPRALFERLFGDGVALTPEARAPRRPVPPQHPRFRQRRYAASWKPTSGPTDRRKLDEYLSSIREIERQIEKAEKDNAQIDPHMEKPYGVPADFAEHFKLMTDMMTVAFQSDLTRVVTFLVTHEGTSRAVPRDRYSRRPPSADAPPQSARPDGEGARRSTRITCTQFAGLDREDEVDPQEGDGSAAR